MPHIRLWIEIPKQDGRKIALERKNYLQTLYNLLTKAKSYIKAYKKNHYRYNLSPNIKK